VVVVQVSGIVAEVSTWAVLHLLVAVGKLVPVQWVDVYTQLHVV
jgi:hypothetical protein